MKTKPTNITTELERILVRNSSQADQIMDANRILMSPEYLADREIMNSLEWNKGLKRVEAITSREKERNAFSEEYHESAYRLDEIGQIAVDYDLKFLKAAFFKCPEKRESELAGLIREYLHRNNIENNTFSADRFYILADPQYFEKYCSDIDNKVGIILFYHPTKGNDHFFRVAQIGSGELDFKRRLRAWKKKDPINAGIHSFVLGFLAALLLLALMKMSLIPTVFLGLLAAATYTGLITFKFGKNKSFLKEAWNKLIVPA